MGGGQRGGRGGTESCTATSPSAACRALPCTACPLPPALEPTTRSQYPRRDRCPATHHAVRNSSSLRCLPGFADRLTRQMSSRDLGSLLAWASGSDATSLPDALSHIDRRVFKSASASFPFV